MARPTKEGLDYFNLDVDFFQNMKVRKIKMACGAQSISVLICLLCNIYRNKGYYILWDKDMPFLIADEVGISEGAVIEILKKAIQVGFFDEKLAEKYGVLTSVEIQKRYSKIMSASKRIGWSINEKYNVIPEETVQTSSKPQKKPQLITEETKKTHVISTQSKVKESKVNKIKEVVEEKGPLQPHVVGELVEASKIRVYKLDALETELKNSLMWKETIAIHNKISMEMVNTKISEFIEHLKLQGEEIKTLSDSKKHFNSWLRIMISKPNSDSKSKIVYDNPDLPPDNSGKWKWINGAWRDTTTFTTSQKRRHGLLPSG